MCQYQLSSLMLPSEAPTPPCAATVCERVGNTLDSTATFRPASDSCSDARMPEPPAPTITTSNLRLVMDGLLEEATGILKFSRGLATPSRHSRRARRWRQLAARGARPSA